MDGQPVDLIFLLLAPEGAGADHLKALARIARLLRDVDVAIPRDGMTNFMRNLPPEDGRISVMLPLRSESFSTTTPV